MMLRNFLAVFVQTIAAAIEREALSMLQVFKPEFSDGLGSWHTQGLLDGLFEVYRDRCVWHLDPE